MNLFLIVQLIFLFIRILLPFLHPLLDLSLNLLFYLFFPFGRVSAFCVIFWDYTFRIPYLFYPFASLSIPLIIFIDIVCRHFYNFFTQLDILSGKRADLLGENYVLEGCLL